MYHFVFEQQASPDMSKDCLVCLECKVLVSLTDFHFTVRNLQGGCFYTAVKAKRVTRKMLFEASEIGHPLFSLSYLSPKMSDPQMQFSEHEQRELAQVSGSKHLLTEKRH